MKKIIILIAAMLIMLTACGGSEPHIYDDAILNGDYAVIKAESADINQDVLSDVYFNYFEKQDLSYLIIVYTDQTDRGVYMSEAYTLSDTGLAVDANGDIVLGDDTGSVMYMPVDGVLKEQ